MKVVGIEKVHYLSKKTNNWVDGLDLHCISDPVQTDRFTGQKVESVFVSARSTAFLSLSAVGVGQEVKFLYDRRGNVDDVVIQPVVDPAPPAARTDKPGKVPVKEVIT